MFQLIQPTTVKLMHINVRTEKHGPNDVDAVDLDLGMDAERQDDRPTEEQYQAAMAEAAEALSVWAPHRARQPRVAHG